MLRVISHHTTNPGTALPFDLVVLSAEERRVRRKVIRLQHGDDILVDFPQAVTLENRDLLELEDGRLVEIIAAEELVYVVTAQSPEHLVRLAWHLGNRHLPAQLEADRILILRDHVIKTMLIGLGATVTDASEPFWPENGAYHGHSHSHGAEDHALLYRK